MPDQRLKISSAGDKRPGVRESGSPAEAPYAEDGKVWPESVSSDPASGLFLRLQSLDDAISFRGARVAAPCPDCGPGAADGRCDDHACDLSLLAGYRKLAEKEIAEIQVRIEKTRGRKAAAAPPPGHAACRVEQASRDAAGHSAVVAVLCQDALQPAAPTVSGEATHAAFG